MKNYEIFVLFFVWLQRYAYPWWKEKEIDSVAKRKAGLCPLTPEETALTLRALDIDRNIQVYIAAGEIYKSEKRMKTLKEAFPNLVWSSTHLIIHLELSIYNCLNSSYI